MSEPMDPGTGQWAVVTAALAQTLSDNGTRIAQSPVRLRNALTDVLADLAHAERARVDILVVAAGEGICADLLGRARGSAGRSDQDLAAAVMAQGFAPEAAAMAVTSWATALGKGAGGTVTSLPPREQLTTDALTAAPPELPTALPAIVPPELPTALPALVPPSMPTALPPVMPPRPLSGQPVRSGPPAGSTPPFQGSAPETAVPVKGDRRRPLAWLAAAAAVLVVAAVVLVAVLFSGDKGKPSARASKSPVAVATSGAAASAANSATPSPAASSTPSGVAPSTPAPRPSGLNGAGATVFVQEGGRGSVTQNATTTPIGSGAGLALIPGESVTAAVGPVVISAGAGQAVRLRLGTGSQLLFISAATAAAAAQFELITGNVYANVAAGAGVGIQSPGGHAQMGPGRLFTTCEAGACQFQALEEPEQVHTRANQMVSLKAHELLTIPVDGPLPSMPAMASASMDQTTTTDSAGAVVTPPDAIRANPVIALNLHLDDQENRASAPIAGGSVLGDWSWTFARTPASVHRHILITVGCPQEGRCGLVATQQTKYATCPTGAACHLLGQVTTEDATGKHLRVAYPTYPVDCTGDGKADGTASAKDELTFSGDGAARAVTGARVVTYTKGICQTSTFATTQNVQLTGAIGKPAATDFPQLGPEELLLERHIAAGGCQRAPILRTGAVADVVCTYPAPLDSKGETRPSRAEFVFGKSGAALNSIYEGVRSTTGLKSLGNCSGGDFPCEVGYSGTAGGRIVVTAGSGAFLASYQVSPFPLLVLATGASPADLYKWYAYSLDFEFYNLRFVAV